MAYVSPPELIYTILASDSPLVTGITSSSILRLYGPPGLPNNYALCKSIVYWFGGSGGSDAYIPKRQKFAEFRCYGNNAVEAEAVYGLLHAALHRRSHSRVTLSNGTAIFQYAALSGETENQNEPISDWPFIRAIYEIQFMEHTV